MSVQRKCKDKYNEQRVNINTELRNVAPTKMQLLVELQDLEDEIDSCNDKIENTEQAVDFFEMGLYPPAGWWREHQIDYSDY